MRFDSAKPGTGCAWNPLGEVQFRTRFQVSDVQNIALMVVDSDGKGIERDHFRSAAFELLVGLILHALYKGESLGRTPCLQDIGQMLTGVGDFAAPDTQNTLAEDMDGDPVNAEAQLVITAVGTRIQPVSLYFISTPKTSKRLVPLTRLLLTMAGFCGGAACYSGAANSLFQRSGVFGALQAQACIH